MTTPETTQTPTPRTDAELEREHETITQTKRFERGGIPKRFADFARTLERELWNCQRVSLLEFERLQSALAARDAEVGRLSGALTAIVGKYDAYRRRGVAPAPAEYGDVVDAIERGRAALGQSGKGGA